MMEKRRDTIDHLVVDKETNTIYVNETHLLKRKKELLLNGYFGVKNIQFLFLSSQVRYRLKYNFYNHCKVIFKYKDEKILLLYNK